MAAGGVHLTSTNAIVAELVKNWASLAGAVAFPQLIAPFIMRNSATY